MQMKKNIMYYEMKVRNGSDRQSECRQCNMTVEDAAVQYSVSQLEEW